MSRPTPEGRTKANFGQAAKNLDLAGTRAVLLVSVGQRYHEGDKLQATVDLVNRSRFGHVTVAVADTLQRTNYPQLAPEEAHRHALREGERWLERNDKILGRLAVPSDVLRWDDALQDPAYPALRARVERAYREDPGYQEAVHATIGRFVDRRVARDPDTDVARAFDDCLAYLIEECPIIMPLWASQGYDHIIYPQPMTAAMSRTQRLFVSTEYPGKGGWLSLRFKKRATASRPAA
ncbi:tRNA-dependent cyclodipeptide synthase [Streptomyces sp. NPDC059740]|uniref:tRNA-dependent cyclodipeptide synthase n=1 Tax=Streptomyces sp. NPDC059740 TaxID=3346926 RepID=UPI003648F302